MAPHICGQATADEPSHSSSVLIRDVPHVRQKPDFCGEACVASWLQKLGATADQDSVFDAAGLDPTLLRGCHTKELATAITKLGFDPGPVWNRIQAANHPAEIDQLWRTMLADLRLGTASIICMRTTNDRSASEHFRLILGYDAATDEVIYHEPADDNGAYRRMLRSKLLSLWPLKYEEQNWLAIRFSLASRSKSRIPSATLLQTTAADYAQHIMRLKTKLPNDNFTIVLERPFVVIGDEDAATVRRRSKQTVAWAVKRLKKQYFARDPERILNIWLFRDKASYDTNAIHLFGSKPSTPYGYYSSSNDALVMNIATGGGTLVHEIVHPFVESNFPRCPAWLNEGLGSLYEQSSSRGDKIVGLTNWRLAGLQRAIKNNSVPTFAQLCGTSTREFYDQDPGTNYAQARYLCYFLQENGLLEKFYHQFVANQKADPTGYQTLQAILHSDDRIDSDMDVFQKSWQEYVMTLRFPS
ncbi:C39 family peptidase [Stieleria marina]|uniref:C39 family peptidase n=1 Tax=Stieleria marina TaxID=1930275 RepID=UPI003AF3E416